MGRLSTVLALIVASMLHRFPTQNFAVDAAEVWRGTYSCSHRIRWGAYYKYRPMLSNERYSIGRQAVKIIAAVRPGYRGASAVRRACAGANVSSPLCSPPSPINGSPSKASTPPSWRSGREQGRWLLKDHPGGAEGQREVRGIGVVKDTEALRAAAQRGSCKRAMSPGAQGLEGDLLPLEVVALWLLGCQHCRGQEAAVVRNRRTEQGAVDSPVQCHDPGPPKRIKAEEGRRGEGGGAGHEEGTGPLHPPEGHTVTWFQDTVPAHTSGNRCASIPCCSIPGSHLFYGQATGTLSVPLQATWRDHKPTGTQ